MPLYKYVTAERIDVLQNEVIRFSQPSALNDPWDLRPHVERVFTDDDIDEHVMAPMKPKSDTQMIDFVYCRCFQTSKTNHKNILFASR